MRMDTTMGAIYEHVEDTYPNEACGVVTLSGAAVPLKNVSDSPSRHFAISPADYVMYVDSAMFFYHSHPNGVAVFSDADHEFQKRNRVPLMVISWPEGEIRMLGDLPMKTVMLGRPFIYGAYDCYTLARDFYANEFDIRVPQLTRPRFGWWESGKQDPFNDHLQMMGMKEVEELEYGDVILFSLDGTKVSHHIGIYVDNNQFLHHGLYRLSSEEPYNQKYRDATTRILRHVTRD